MRVNKWLVPTLALVLLLGTVGVAQATGWWLVSGREMVNLEQLTGGADVKGWMTLEQVAVGHRHGNGGAHGKARSARRYSPGNRAEGSGGRDGRV